jgi:hypothetical protein
VSEDGMRSFTAEESAKYNRAIEKLAKPKECPNCADLRATVQRQAGEIEEVRKRNGALALQLREERLRKSAPSSALLPKLEAAESRADQLQAALDWHKQYYRPTDTPNEPVCIAAVLADRDTYKAQVGALRGALELAIDYLHEQLCNGADCGECYKQNDCWIRKLGEELPEITLTATPAATDGIKLEHQRIKDENDILWLIFKTCIGCRNVVPGIVYGCDIQKHLSWGEGHAVGYCNQREDADGRHF